MLTRLHSLFRRKEVAMLNKSDCFKDIKKEIIARFGIKPAEHKPVTFMFGFNVGILLVLEQL